MTARTLDDLHRGFRESFLAYEELTAQLRSWAEAFPHLVRLDSLATTEEGREVWLLTLGPEPDRTRPAAWVDGNMHAAELCGSSVALAIAEDVLRLHAAPDEPLHSLPDHLREQLRDVLFYIVPRISPDGAECVLNTGRWLRSVPRDRRPNRGAPRWVVQDVDGDGKAFAMRIEDPSGDHVESREVPGLMLPRRLEDPPPYYRVYPEGIIENWDGVSVPPAPPMSDHDPDLNRNFPWSWAPEPQQEGAGAFPMSEPESRAIVEFVSARPHIFTWLNLHTFGGVLIRPLGDKPDNRMDQQDLAYYRQLEAWAKDHTGYPTVSGFEEFTYEPDKPLHGDLTDFAFHQRGCFAWVCELWDLFEQLGIERPKRFVDRYSHWTRDDLVRVGQWDAEHNRGRIFRPWRKAQHPQLGEVEVGGVDSRFGLWNPPFERIDEVCRGQSAVYLRVAAMVPRVTLRQARTEPLHDALRRLDVRVDNRGYLPTYGLRSARQLPWNEPLYAELVDEQGCELVTPSERRQQIGHLEGWGRGLYDGTGMPYMLRSGGSSPSTTVRWTLRGSGAVTLRVGSCRTGFVEQRIEVA